MIISEPKVHINEVLKLLAELPRPRENPLYTNVTLARDLRETFLATDHGRRVLAYLFDKGGILRALFEPGRGVGEIAYLDSRRLLVLELVSDMLCKGEALDATVAPESRSADVFARGGDVGHDVERGADWIDIGDDSDNGLDEPFDIPDR